MAGNVMPVLGKTTIECSLCGADGTPQWTGKHAFYVADIITGPILGADFLQKYRMDVQFSTGLLSFPNGNVPPVAREVGQERCSVILAHDVRFDNNTREVIALGRLSRPGESVSKLSSCVSSAPSHPRGWSMMSVF